MQNSIFVAGSSVVAFGFSFLVSTGAIDTADKITRPPLRELRIVALEYNQGIFTQTSRVKGVSSMPARWAAEITRNGEHLCSGGSNSVYQNGTITLTADEWTGDNCPDLMHGDKASASWEWRDSNGFFHVISKEITIGEITP